VVLNSRDHRNCTLPNQGQPVIIPAGLSFGEGINQDGVAKSPPCGVTAFFQDLDILKMYAFDPEKPPSLVGRNFCLAIP
jgi:hypothetical protein